jgi:glycosyltransferase involved in cell wall biosynthesis
MKKLLLVSHQLDFSGAPNALLSAARVLREMGCEIDLLPLAEGPLEAEFLALGVRRIRSTDFRGYNLVILNTAISARAANHIPEDVKFLIWLHESPLLFVHSDVPFMVSQAAERAIALLFPTEFTAQEWARYGSLRSDERPVFVCLAPVKVPDLAMGSGRGLAGPGYTKKPLRIITIDPVEFFRGHRVLALALQHLVSRGIDIHYTAAGASPSAIKALFPFLPSEQLNATDRIPRAQVLELLAQSDVYVSASAFATQNLGLCEATLLGIPSVVSDIPVHRAWSDKVGGAVALFPLNRWRVLSDRLSSVTRFLELQRRVSAAASDVAKAALAEARLQSTIRQLLSL